MFDPVLAKLDATAQADLVARGHVSGETLRDECFARIEALNPLLRAIVTVSEERGRAAPGPFSGVPFLVKDAAPWPGLRWSIGSRLFVRNIAPGHTRYGERLVQSGLVCVGKSATSEFGLLGSTETLLEGATHNPWDLSFSAAGSSGGSAAAVAAGIVPVAHANDGGGSIRIPASVCGVFGFKPSRDRTVSASFVTNDFLAMTSDHFITRSVRDSAHLLAITEDGAELGYVCDPIDRPLRIGAFTRTAMGEEPEDAVKRAHQSAMSLLAELGHHVETIDAPAYDGNVLGDAFFFVAGAAIAGAADMVEGMRGSPAEEEELEPFTWALIERARAGGEAGLDQARAALAAAARSYLQATRAYDVILTPTLATTAWRLGHLSPLLGRDELVARTARSVGYTPLENIAGCPAMSVPLSFPEGGLPIGAHFAAAKGAEKLLFGLAYQLERARPWADRWPPFSIPRLAECRRS